MTKPRSTPAPIWSEALFSPAELVLVNPVACNGLRMKRLYGNPVHQAVCRVPATKNRCTLVAIDHTTASDLVSVHYLGGFRVKVLKGALPKGRLRVQVDTVPVVDEPLPFFTKEVAPSKVPWKKSMSLFHVIPVEGNVARPQELVGFALPNASEIKAFLDLESAPRGALLEIQALGGFYLGEKSCFPLAPKEILIP